MMELKIGTTTVPLVVKKNARAKRLRITVGSRGVTVVAPKYLPDPEIKAFVNEKKEWIYTRVKEFRLLKEELFAGGKIFYLKGKKYFLEVRHHNSGQLIVLVEDDKLVVYLPGTRKNMAPNYEKKLKEWYRQLAKDTIAARLSYFSNKIDVQYNSFTIKDQKTRWGSCSGKKNLNFSWRLIMAPPEVLDYVIVHELCHLVHLNHSPAFWHLVKSYLPDYAKSKSWLADNGIKLHAF